MRGLLAKAAVAFLAVFVAAPTAQAAFPRIVIVSGESLDERVVLSDWDEIAVLVTAIAGARATALLEGDDRPSLDLALFWGPMWDDYVNEGRPLAALRPEQAQDRGRFFPAWKGHPAAIDLPWAGLWPRVVPAKGLAVLERNGVPTELREDGTPWIAVGAGGVLLGLAAIVLARRFLKVP